jgi:hypothetical protein
MRRPRWRTGQHSWMSDKRQRRSLLAMQCGSRCGFPTPVNKSATSGHRGCPFLALSRRRSRANGCLSGHSLDVLLFALMRTFVRRFVIRFDVDQSFLLLIASPLQRNHARSTTPRPNGDICVSVGDCRKMPSAPTLGCVPPEWLGDHAPCSDIWR